MEIQQEYNINRKIRKETKMLWKKGFTMIELLVVLIILGILVAVAAPMYLANVNRAKVSEALASMGMIRQAEREYNTKHGSFLLVGSGNLANDPEAASNPGLNIKVGTAQYFSSAAYTVVAGGTSGSSGLFATPVAQDFIIAVNGTASVPCAGALIDCAVNAADIQGSGKVYRMEMDNSGRVFISYDSGSTWKAY